MVRLAYGSGTCDFDISDRQILCTAAASRSVPCETPVAALVAEALAHPTGGPALAQIISPGDTVCILVSDITRSWQHTGEYLPLLIDRLNALGVPDADILIVIAIGTHRKQTAAEHRLLVGEEVFRRIRVIDHDCDDDAHLICVGETRRGNRVLLNSYAMACSKLILTGGVVPHFIAGYGGGGKSIVPGISARSTVNANHNLALNPGLGNGIHSLVHSGSLAGNPLREDIDDGAALAHPAFAINVVADENGRVVKAFAGDLASVHQAAVAFTERLVTVEVPRRAPLVLVSAGGFPRDINLRQSSKALHNALFVAEEHATILLFAECRDQFGDAQCREQILSYTDMASREIALRRNFTIGAFIGFYVASLAERYSLILVSSFPKEVFRNTKVHPASDAGEALRLAESLHGGSIRTLPAIVLPSGGSVLPHVAE